MQESHSKSGKAKISRLHSFFFNAAKALLSQKPKFQGTSYQNKAAKGATIFPNSAQTNNSDLPT